jgi:hypothetical protein
VSCKAPSFSTFLKRKCNVRVYQYLHWETHGHIWEPGLDFNVVTVHLAKWGPHHTSPDPTKLHRAILQCYTTHTHTHIHTAHARSTAHSTKCHAPFCAAPCCRWNTELYTLRTAKLRSPAHLSERSDHVLGGFGSALPPSAQPLPPQNRGLPSTRMTRCCL